MAAGGPDEEAWPDREQGGQYEHWLRKHTKDMASDRAYVAGMEEQEVRPDEEPGERWLRERRENRAKHEATYAKYMEAKRHKKPQELPESEDPRFQNNNMWQVLLPEDEEVRPDEKPHERWLRERRENRAKHEAKERVDAAGTEEEEVRPEDVEYQRWLQENREKHAKYMEENRRKKPQVLPKSEDPQSQHNNMWQVVLPSKEPDKAIHPTWPDQEKPHNSAEKPLNSEELYSEVAEHFQKAEKQRELDEKLRDQEAKIKEFSVIEAKKKHTQQNIEMHAKHMAEKRRQAPQDLHDKRTEYRALLRHERDKAIHQMWPEL